MKKLLLGAAALAMIAAVPQYAMAQDAMATPGKAVSMVLLPKFLGILPFDQAHKGAEEAAKELQNPTPLQFLGPTPQNSVAGQIEIVTNATTQGVKAIMISNNSGDQIVPAAKAAQAKGIKVVIAEHLGRSPVEPAAMQMKDRGALPSLRRPGPPARYASDRVGLKGDAAWGGDALHDAVERTASGGPFELAFHACDCRSQRRHCGRIFRAEGMDHGPRLLDCCVLADFGLH